MKGRPHTTRQGPIPNSIANDTTTLALITRIAIRDNRQCRGIWSRYGQPYIPHGIPDFTLPQRGRTSHRENQKVEESAKTSEKQQIKSDVNKGQTKSGPDIMTSLSNEIASVRICLDMGRYRFPRDKIIESEVRCRMGKNGKFLSSQASISDHVFTPINLTKITLPKQQTIDKASRQSVKHTEYRLYQDHLNSLDDQEAVLIPEIYNQLSKSIQLSSNAEQNPAPTVKRSKLRTSDESPISRWRSDFSRTRQQLSEQLQEILVRQSMDRSMVMHDRALLSKITESVERRAADRLPHKTSVWSEVAHERKIQQNLGLKEFDHLTLDNRKRTELYWELQVFVQKFSAEDGIKVGDQDLMATIESIKRSLEDRTPLDLSFVIAVTSKLDLKVCESPRHLRILSFLCKYLKISEEAVREFGEKGLSLPPSIHAIIAGQ